MLSIVWSERISAILRKINRKNAHQVLSKLIFLELSITKMNSREIIQWFQYMSNMFLSWYFFACELIFMWLFMLIHSHIKHYKHIQSSFKVSHKIYFNEEPFFFVMCMCVCVLFICESKPIIPNLTVWCFHRFIRFYYHYCYLMFDSNAICDE